MSYRQISVVPSLLLHFATDLISDVHIEAFAVDAEVYFVLRSRKRCYGN